MWKSNFDPAEWSDGVRLQHKTSSKLHSLQASPASSTAHHAFNSHPSVLHSQVSSDSRQQIYFDVPFRSSILCIPLLLYTNHFLSSQIPRTYPFPPLTHLGPCVCVAILSEHQRHFFNCSRWGERKKDRKSAATSIFFQSAPSFICDCFGLIVTSYKK